MEICIECQRHIKTSLEVCPFCHVAPRAAPFVTMKRTAIAAMTPFFLAACYGGPMVVVPCEENCDMDGDGYSEQEDCDDNDFWVNPGEDEVCGDEIDNNCNDEIDEEECVEPEEE